MGYAEYIRNLLKPVGIYNLESGSGAAEITALGAALDGAAGPAEMLDRECTVGTAESYGLSLYEKLLPLKPVDYGVVCRRRAVEALLSIDSTSFTVDKLNATLAGCGISALAEETETQYTVNMTFPENRGVLNDIESVKTRIESIMPCHVTCIYVYSFCPWSEIESGFITWGAIENADMTWGGLESFFAE